MPGRLMEVIESWRGLAALGHADQALERVRRFLEIDVVVGRDRVAVLLEGADFALMMQDYDEMHRYLQQAGGGPFLDARGELRWYHLFALCSHSRRDEERSLELARRGIEIARGLEERQILRYLHGIAGQALRGLSRLDEALGYAREGLRMAEEDSDTASILTFRTDIVNCLLQRSSAGEAEEEARESLAYIERTMLAPQNRMVPLGQLGQALHAQGRVDEARQAAEEGVVLARSCGDRVEEALFLQDCSRADETDGNLLAASVSLRDAVEIFAELGLPVHEWNGRLKLVRFSLAQGDAAVAAASFTLMVIGCLERGAHRELASYADLVLQTLGASRHEDPTLSTAFAAGLRSNLAAVASSLEAHQVQVKQLVARFAAA